MSEPTNGTIQDENQGQPVEVSAKDGYPLAGTLFRAHESRGRTAIINSATAVPRGIYRRFAAALSESGYDVLTYDYRGIGDSRPKTLRGFPATMRDWGMLDMAGAVDWMSSELSPKRTFLVGHSVGGQVAGLLENSSKVHGMVTFSSQSGHWRMQGAEQKAVVWFHMHLTMPIFASVWGYVPWGKFAGAEDLPAGVAQEWARWSRLRNYLLDDSTLPLERYQSFQGPVLAYSIGDDKWGTPKAVDAMMRAYPNLERRHLEPKDAGLNAIGHFGYFRAPAKSLWAEPIAWLDAH